MSAHPGLEVDHKRGVWLNQDPETKILDNRRGNLRVITHAQNGQNRGKQQNNTSGLKGVTWERRRAKWQAQITANGRHYFCGYYDTPEEATVAHDCMCAFLHGLRIGRPNNANPNLDNLPPRVATILDDLLQQIVEQSVNRPDDFGGEI